MYVLQSASQVLEQYNLSTPFDPSTRNSNPKMQFELLNREKIASRVWF